MFLFGLTNFLSLSDRMSDMLKKFSTSLGIYEPKQKYNWYKLDLKLVNTFISKISYILCNLFQGSKLALANSQNASWNSGLRVENIGTRKKLRVRYFIKYLNLILFSKMFKPVDSKSSGKVEAPRNTNSRSFHAITHFHETKEWVLCQRKGEGWIKFQPQETIAISQGNVYNCSKLIASWTQQFASSN